MIDIEWPLNLRIIYSLVLLVVCMRIIYDTRNTTKTLAYLLFALFVPFVGIAFYFIFGINYRKRKIYTRKLAQNDDLVSRLMKDIYGHTRQTFNEHDAGIQNNKELAYMLINDSMTPITSHNEVKLLKNGENKFPEVISVLQQAKDHIHIEYYIYDDDEIGRAIEKVLVEKAREGVKVRFIYDDFGSRSIRGRMHRRMQEAGIEIFPFYKIFFIPFANRINYRNHRKIIVVDGQTAFIGGINVSDRYVNKEAETGRLFWRDMHMRIDGPAVQYLQYLFLADWNFCSDISLQPDHQLFPSYQASKARDNKVVQVVASGPDSETPSILFSVLKAINLAKNEILITTPYFIPGESLINALITASLSGVTVKILVPGTSDSIFVNAAACSYYTELLDAGVSIYRYKKGFLHAKTMVTDCEIAIVGTANMDLRSFDLNFEVNAIVYNAEVASELKDIFYEDLKDAEQIDPVEWDKRPMVKQLLEKTARLLSPLL
jgi:cardiolipin synthase